MALLARFLFISWEMKVSTILAYTLCSILTMTIDKRNSLFCLICFHTIEVREWVLGKPPSDPMKVSNPNGADGEWSNEDHVKFLTTEPEIAGDDKSRRYCVSDAIVNGGRFKVSCVQRNANYDLQPLSLRSFCQLAGIRQEPEKH